MMDGRWDLSSVMMGGNNGVDVDGKKAALGEPNAPCFLFLFIAAAVGEIPS